MYNNENINKLLTNLDIVKVIGEYVNLTKSGANYKGLSPFKDEKTPSFVVSPSKNIFKCFSTGIGGNVIEFYRRINNLTFPEAIRELSIKYNINIREMGYNYKKENPKHLLYYSILKDAQQFFMDNLLNDYTALKYMEDRDYSKEDIFKYKIGYSKNEWHSLYNHLISKYELEDLLHLGLIKENNNGEYYDIFRNRIMLSIYNKDGRIIGFGARAIEDIEDIAKYINSSESDIFIKGNELYGIFDSGKSIRNKNYTILMEGYFDVLTAHKAGLDISIASLGTAFTEEQAKLIKKYTSNIVIAYDNDEAGQSAIEKAINILNKYEFNIKCMLLDNGIKDPDEYIKKYGNEEFVNILKKSMDVFDYLYMKYTKDMDVNLIPVKQDIINKFRNFFDNLYSELYRNEYMNRLAKNLSINNSYLNNYYKKKNNKIKNNINKNIEKVKNRIINKEYILEETAIMLLLDNNKYLNYFKNIEFKDTQLKNIFDKLFEINFDLQFLQKLELDEEEKRIFLELRTKECVSAEEKHFSDLLKDWLRYNIMTELNDLKLKKEIIKYSNEDIMKEIEFKRILNELSRTTDINEVEKMYNLFKDKRGD